MTEESAGQGSDDLDGESQTQIISTGHPEFDKKLGGGIPRGSLTLIAGPSGTGKSVLTQQFIWGSLSSAGRVILYTTERSTKSHVSQMESLGLDVVDFLLLGRFRIVAIATSDEAVMAKGFDILAKHIETGYSHDLAVIDSLTPMVTASTAAASTATAGPVTQVISFFERCRKLCSNGRTIAVTLHTHVTDEGTRERIRTLCDTNLVSGVQQLGDRLVNTMEIRKIGGATKTSGEVVSFQVEPGVGLRIIPMSTARV